MWGVSLWRVVVSSTWKARQIFLRRVAVIKSLTPRPASRGRLLHLFLIWLPALLRASRGLTGIQISFCTRSVSAAASQWVSITFIFLLLLFIKTSSINGDKWLRLSNSTNHQLDVKCPRSLQAGCKLSFKCFLLRLKFNLFGLFLANELSLSPAIKTIILYIYICY